MTADTGVELEEKTSARDSALDEALALPPERFLDREISWLQFNERVLQLAGDENVPLLERCRYLAIFTSNLDEFFMVRVAGLKRRIATGIAVRSASGLEPREVLEQISLVAHELLSMQARLYRDQVRPALESEGITIVRWDELSDDEHTRIGGVFTERLFPVLTPLAVDPAHPFPYISGLSLNLAVVLVNPRTGKEHFARVKVPPVLPRLLRVEPGPDRSPLADMYDTRFVPLEDVISAHLDHLFPGMEVREHFTFRVTRNEDLEVEEDDAENLLTALERELTRRRFGPPVRLEVEEAMDAHVLDLLIRELGVAGSEVYRLPAPLDLRALNVIADLERSELHFEPFVARTNSDLAPTESAKARDIFAAIRKQDVLLQHPYDSFSTSVQAFIEQAAVDPRVLAIKQTLYRTSGDSPIIDALIDAAEAGKQVLAVVEIKARFDEQNNISWARKLEHAGVHVVYGLVAPRSVRSGLIDLIDAEIEHEKREPGTGHIAWKVNSIVDEQLIDALYRASQAGVRIELWVRGICSLRPSVEGLSENIEVRCILGRFLEHSRIFLFAGGGDPQVYIGSADMMHRNLDRRVEALVRLKDPRHLADMRSLMNRGMSDEYMHWKLGGDGRWIRHHVDADGTELADLQAALIEMHAKRRRKARRR